jgi:hypothetical protein
MTERLHIGTHKGLFELARHNGVWDIVDVQFLGDPVSAVLPDTDGIVYAALDLGHFGAKLWRRDRTGNWREPRCRHSPQARGCRRRPPSLVAWQDLGARTGRRSGTGLGRHDAGRAFPHR